MFRISLRQLFVLMAFVALAIVSLTSASPFWEFVVGAIALIATLAAIIVGIFDRGPRQAFAIGFAIGILSYGLLVTNFQMDNTLQGRLPTTRLMNWIYPWLDRSYWQDPSTGKKLTKTEMGQMLFSGGGTPTVNGRPITYVQRLTPDNFVFVGHHWFALLLGCIGGLFARFVYMRRAKESSAPTST